MKRLVPLCAVLACSMSGTDPGPGTPTLHLVTDQLSSPVFVTAPPGDTLRLFVVEQEGRVRVLRRDSLLAAAFLDLRGRINAGGEEGLLSLAFHPEYATNRRSYVYFTSTTGDLRVVRYTVSTADSNVADEATADTVLAVAHPGQSNHNGGQLAFGPDGRLYAGLGDGGGGGDVPGNAQNRHALLGKLLRLDADGATGYTIPANNPFASDTTAEPEIWALGLRNPWRFSFDRQTGDLYIGDVGQGAWEEVNVEPAASPGGVNYGWNVMEGMHCYPPGTPTCNQVGLTLPLVEYNQAGDPCSVTGGYVYRGTRVPALAGHYLYADFCAGFVRGFRYVGGQAIGQRDWTPELGPGGNVSSFGEDGRGELYVVVHGGELYRIVEAR